LLLTFGAGDEALQIFLSAISVFCNRYGIIPCFFFTVTTIVKVLPVHLKYPVQSSCCSYTWNVTILKFGCEQVKFVRKEMLLDKGTEFFSTATFVTHCFVYIIYCFCLSFFMLNSLKLDFAFFISLLIKKLWNFLKYIPFVF